METAVKCVEFLKKNNVGHGTFIGLDKVHTACDCTAGHVTCNTVM